MAKRNVNYEEVLQKYESGKWPTQAALAQHLGILRSHVGHIIKVAKEQREQQKKNAPSQLN